MMRELSADPPDLVILESHESPMCLLIGSLLHRAGIPFLISSQSTSLHDSIMGRRAPLAVKRFVAKSEGVIVPEQTSREHFQDLGMSADRVFIAPISVDVDRFVPPAFPEQKAEARHSLGLPEKTICLFEGRLVEDDGVMELVEAFRLLRPADRGLHLIIVGDGPLRATIKSSMAKDRHAEGSISLVGDVPEGMLPKYYRASDIFVLSTRRDAWGVVLKEVMSTGLTVVSAGGASGALDLIEDGVSGFVVPRKRPLYLAEAIMQLHENPERRNAMGRKARDRILQGFTARHEAMGIISAATTTLGGIPRSDATLTSESAQNAQAFESASR